MKNWTHISKVINSRFMKSSFARPVKAAIIVSAADKVIKELGYTRDDIKPETFVNGELMISVTSASLLQEINLHSPVLIKTLEEKYGIKNIKKIKARIRFS